MRDKKNATIRAALAAVGLKRQTDISEILFYSGQLRDF